MTDLFSTPAQHAFEHDELSHLQDHHDRGVGSSSNVLGDGDFTVEEGFEVEDCVRRIREGGYKTIGLQFPDELLPYSVKVFRAIQKGIQDTGAQAYVLADSTYGSCCPDVLSCLHLPADYLIHYGHACLTPTDALPVHYVFPRRKLDLEAAKKALLDATIELADGSNKGVVIVWDVAYDWLADDIVEVFSTLPHPVSFATIQRPSARAHGALGKSPALRSVEPPAEVKMEECVIWYLGDEGRGSVNLQMTHAANPIYAFSPASTNPVTPLHPRTSKLLQKRLFALHSAMASDVFALVVGNVGLASSQDMMRLLRSELSRAGKKSYTISVGRLNPAKLANFAEVECFVLVGCAEGGVVDSKEFYRPIITPWELLLALRGASHEWEPNKWTLDFDRVIEDARSHGGRPPSRPQSGDDEQGPPAGDQHDNANASEPDRDVGDPEFSLVTGTLRSKKLFNQNRHDDASKTPGVIAGMQDLTLRNKEFSLMKLESAGSVYLASREFQGLDPRYGMDEPSQLEEGRSGIARGYEGT